MGGGMCTVGAALALGVRSITRERRTWPLLALTPRGSLRIHAEKLVAVGLLVLPAALLVAGLWYRASTLIWQTRGFVHSPVLGRFLLGSYGVAPMLAAVWWAACLAGLALLGHAAG